MASPKRTVPRVLAAVAAGWVAWPALPAGAAPPPAGEPSVAEECKAAFGRDAIEAPSEGLVAPGDPISINVTWGVGWKPNVPVDVLACTTVDGVVAEDLSVRRRVAEDGLFVHDLQVPSTAPGGAAVCERALVIGQSASGRPKEERPDPGCFTVGLEPTVARTGPADNVSRGHHGAAPLGAAVAQPSRSLARTGPAGRGLVLAAGLLFLIGGGAVAAGRRRGGGAASAQLATPPVVVDDGRCQPGAER